jgi:DNA-binding SARP family transcriptional activator
VNSPDWPHPARRAAHAAGALLGGALLLAVPPMALVRFVGWPLPHSISAVRTAPALLTQPVSDDLLIKTLACIVWLLWALFAAALLIELVATARGTTAPRLPGLTPLQALAAAIISATTIALVAAAARTTLQSTGPPIATASALQPAAAHQLARAEPAPGQAADDDRHPSATYRVRPYDSLWSIAEHQLGDPNRWHDLYQLNRGRPQPDGRSLQEPRVIRPGWVLLLPEPNGHPPAPSRPAKPTRTRPPHHHPPTPPSTSTPPAHPRSSPARSPGAGGGAAKPSSPSPAHPSTRPAHQPPQRPSHDDRDHHQPPFAVTLPSGAIIGMSIATSIGVAIAIARLRRQRRRIPARVPGTSAPEPPLPPPLARVHRAHLARQRDPGQAPPLPFDHPTPPPTAPPEPPPAWPPTPQQRQPDRSPAGPEPQPDETINVSLSDDRELPLNLDRTPGIGLIGDGADGAARCIAVSLLARSGKDQPELVITRADAQDLFGTTDLDAVPGVVIVPDLQDALARLQAEIIHRNRLLETADTSDFATYRTRNPDEPLPTILLITRPDTHLTERTASVLALGRERAIIGLILGTWPPGGTCTIDTNGHVTTADGPAQHLLGSRMFQMAQDEADIMLATLAAARGTQDQKPQDRKPRHRHPDPPPRSLPEPIRDRQTISRPVQLSILGAFRLRAGGQRITKGLRRKGQELLIYLALHPDGATTDALLDALWPEAHPEEVIDRFHTITSNIRRVLRDATGIHQAAFLLHTTDRYRLDPDLIAVDLWLYRQALAEAAHAADDDTRIQALTEATNIWTGNLTGWPDTEWLEPWRETLRRDAVDTLSRLAELLQHRQPEQALALLEHAITHDRYTEELYRRIMKQQATLGRRDAIRRTYQLLEARLTEIDAEPDQETTTLLTQLRTPS